MRKTCALCLLLVGLLLQPLSVRAVSDSDLLLSAYLRYQLSEKVAEHSQGLIQNAPEPVAALPGAARPYGYGGILFLQAATNGAAGTRKAFLIEQDASLA